MLFIIRFLKICNLFCSKTDAAFISFEAPNGTFNIKCYL